MVEQIYGNRNFISLFYFRWNFWSPYMNWLTDLYWNIRLKIEDKIYEWQSNRELARLEKENFALADEDNNEIIATWEDEEVEVKPKKKKAKKKSVKKVKKSN